MQDRDVIGCQAGELLDSGMWICIDRTLIRGPWCVQSWSAGGSQRGDGGGNFPAIPEASPSDSHPLVTVSIPQRIELCLEQESWVRAGR